MSIAYHRTLLFSGQVVLLTRLTLAAEVLTWAFASIKFQVDMGSLLGFMFLWNMLGALILIPALATFVLPATYFRKNRYDDLRCRVPTRMPPALTDNLRQCTPTRYIQVNVDDAMQYDHAEATSKRASYYERIGTQGLTPLWEVLHGLVTPEPVTPVLPAYWSYDEIRPALMEAGSLITAKEAERRVLILENPGMRGKSAITRTLYAGLQLIMPGEVAPAHRHTQSALRFVIEGSGAYTAVDGEKTTMNVGDFVITPSWTWHDHGNPSSAPMVWLDGLDIPLITALDASFAEPGLADSQPIFRPEGDALARYGQGLLPVDWKPEKLTSPIFNYPYARSRDALYGMQRRGDADPCHGYKLRYINPASGDFAMPTIAAFLQLFPKGFETSNYRSTDATVIVIVEGTGESRIGEKIYAWGPRDILVVPPWTHVRHQADEEAVIFSFSDRALQQKLGLWREDRSNAA